MDAPSPAALLGLVPSTFADFVLVYGEDTERELIDGTVVERMPTYGEHDRLSEWLESVFTTFLQARKFGTMLCAPPVKIHDRRVRRPDFAYVSRENTRALKDGAFPQAPDMVVEVISPGDFRAALAAQEADYKAAGVPEIIFIDPTRRMARVSRRRPVEMVYDDEMIAQDGYLKFKALNVVLLMEWVLADEKPAIAAVMEKIVHPLQRRW
jgi:Uma2 family endonuclease